MFRFKQFTIHQDRTAMKVCTDACVLGAFADVAETSEIPVRILDIGTGTGLLALMAAQRNPLALVDAVEVDEAAFGQAVENVANSPFSGRGRVWYGRVQDFVPPHPYDHILTNPPFYTNHLRSPNSAVNRALHTDELPFPKLIEAIGRLLKPDGQWWVLLPPSETVSLIKLAAAMGLTPYRQLHLRHNERKSVFRIITGFSYVQRTTSSSTLDIYESDSKGYTPAFRALLRDFYLIF
ncbi:tRNA1(Val) (adenine(37)-N6)-methyltransferase [Spirosoma arcticum]